MAGMMTASGKKNDQINVCDQSFLTKYLMELECGKQISKNNDYTEKDAQFDYSTSMNMK